MHKMNAIVNKEPIKSLTTRSARNSQDSCFSNDTLQFTINSSFCEKTELPKKTETSNKITARTLSKEMLNPPQNENQSLEDDNSVSAITRDKFGRQSFKLPARCPPSVDKNEKTHRRSKSYGNATFFIASESFDKEELKKHVETNLYQPIEPITEDSNCLYNESMRIFLAHKTLIKEDRTIQREIDDLLRQMEQLKITADNIKTHNDLLKQKNLLMEENKKLQAMMN